MVESVRWSSVSSVLSRVLAALVLSVMVAGGADVAAHGQDAKTTLVEPPAPLLPQQVGDWVRQPDTPSSAANDPKAETILSEDGLKREEHGVYRSGSAGPSVTVTARQFVDATGAHAAYSFYQRPGSI